ncbi:class I SAM-dependent methyltransferase [Nitrogeniibacter aestuarii]|uniref:class I SAM-dependent methyltransferase n=1 Tax=Nitrogeniibacter aestuarii TaxID=2815343 RepID=UPI001D12E73C|nr:class I SAM-dependent methyltransferase [Nitrogeniibacter aestuarii]
MPVLRFILAQVVAWALVYAALYLGVPLRGVALALTQAVAAAGLAHVLRSERWWRWVHLAFTPLIWAASQFNVAPGWYLAAFAVLAVFYWSSFRTRVPLFLSNRPTLNALAKLLPTHSIHFLDAGAGTGTVLRPLARQRPESSFVGFEAAPGPWLIGYLLNRRQANLLWRRGDFWQHDWSMYDVVYVFLSPVPMADVWGKAQRELRPDALLISNSFPVPDVEPDRVIDPESDGARPLYVYHPGRTRSAKRQKKG